MRSISKQFPLSFAAVKKIIDVLWQSLCLITTKVKLPLRDDVVGIAAVIRNQCHLTDVACVGENNIARTYKRVRETTGVFLGDKVISQFVKIKPSQMITANNWYAAIHKGLDLYVRTKGTHSDFLSKVFNGLYAPSSRDLTQFAADEFTVCEGLEVHEPRLENGLCHLL